MLGKTLNNTKIALTICRDNKLILFTLLSTIGLTSGNAYIAFIPAHPHEAPVTVVNKTIINKMECDHECKELIFTIARKVVAANALKHTKEEH